MWAEPNEEAKIMTKPIGFASSNYVIWCCAQQKDLEYLSQGNGHFNDKQTVATKYHYFNHHLHHFNHHYHHHHHRHHQYHRYHHSHPSVSTVSSTIFLKLMPNRKSKLIGKQQFFGTKNSNEFNLYFTFHL